MDYVQLSIMMASHAEINNSIMALSRQARNHNTPMIGYWINEDGFRFTDASYPDQFNSYNDALKTGKKYAQESILKIKPNGEADLIP